MKRLTALWRELAFECASWCGTSAIRDYQTVTDRVEFEGESFLTIALPRFCKDFERSLELGSVADDLFAGFQRRGGLPLFLVVFLQQIFDSSGTLLAKPSIECIISVRQLTLVFGKINRLASNRRLLRAMRDYVKIEAELEAFDFDSLEEVLPLYRKASTLLWADVFSQVENSILDSHQLWKDWLTSSSEVKEPFGLQSIPGWDKIEDPLDSILGLPVSGVAKRRHKQRRDFHVGRPIVFDKKTRVTPEFWRDKDRNIFPVPVTNELDLIPRHGPGATADGLRGNAKFSVNTWPQRLESVFPYGDYALPSWRYYDQLDRVQFLEPGSETPVKVVAVPKTDKTVRIIAEEPTAVQYMQQALSMQLVNCLENGPELPPSFGGKDSALGRFFVGFRDQEENRRLARKGSVDASLATLDLSEASDRVLNEHVLLLFERFPRLSEAIQATRSTKAQVPGQGVIPLTKFSSMGSALCFPVEAMVFTTIIFCAIATERRVPLDRALINSMRGSVRVYGDDIVVPVDCVPRVIQFLELFGLKVNKDKSFWNGKFRESCGGDFYDGEWVTPIRLRHELPRSLADVDGVVGLVAFRNLLYRSGFWRTAGSLDERIRTLFKGRFPIVEETAAGLGRHSMIFDYEEQWSDAKLHSPRVSGAIVRSVIPKSKATGHGALMKHLLKRSIVPSQDPDHLERQGRPETARIKLRGIRPY
nr:MAG: hypothetical protein 2 [Leviviridae sp.]